MVGCHWKLKYNGVDTKWGEKLDTIMKKWYKNCCTRGPEYDFVTTMRVLCRKLLMDGDILLVKTTNNHGWPLFQFIGSHRIGSSTSNMSGADGVKVEINGKLYKCFDGIVYDGDEKIAYSIKKDDAQIATVPQDPKTDYSNTTILAEDACLIYKPMEFDKGRGLPALYASVLYGLQQEDLDNFLMDIAKLEATIAYIIQNDAGQAPIEYENLLDQIEAQDQTGNNVVSLPALEPTVHGVNVVKGPTIPYIKAEGGDIKSFRSQRPSEEIQMYAKTIETKLMSAIGTPHQVIYSPDTISGRAVNAITQQINKNVHEMQTTILTHIKPAVIWAIAVLMENGYLDKNYDEDLMEVIDFEMPPPYTLDINDDNKIGMELYKVGLISGEDYCKKNGLDFATITKKRKDEIFDLLTDVEEAKKKFPTMSEAAILNLFTQRGQSNLRIEDQTVPTQNDGKMQSHLPTNE